MSGLKHLSKQGQHKRVFIPDHEWHDIGDPGEPAFEAGWSNSAGYEPAGFRMDADGWVHLKGVVDGGTSDIFLLPEEYWSINDNWNNTTAVLGSGVEKIAEVQCTPSTGFVGCLTASGANTELLLDGVKWPTFEHSYDDGLMIGTGSADLNPASAGFNRIYQGADGVNVLHISSTVSVAATTCAFTWDGEEASGAQMLPIGSFTTGTQGGYLEVSAHRPLYISQTHATSFNASLYYTTQAAHEQLVEPSLSNSWVVETKDTNNDWYGIGFIKDRHGIVHLKGRLKSGSSASAVMMTLPVGSRPAYDVYHVGVTESVVSSTTTTAVVKVGSNGEVSMHYGGSTTYSSISGVSFYAG